MTPQEHLEQIKRDFTYVGEKRDKWVIGPFEGAFEGDCEDFALTLLLRIAGSKVVMWNMLEDGRAAIIHVTSDRGNGHAVLWLEDWGHVDSIHQYWREPILFKKDFAYSARQVRRKLDGKEVKAPANKKLMVLAGVLGAVAAVLLLGGKP